jgi:hypothetical protein
MREWNSVECLTTEHKGDLPSPGQRCTSISLLIAITGNHVVVVVSNDLSKMGGELINHFKRMKCFPALRRAVAG